MMISTIRVPDGEELVSTCFYNDMLVVVTTNYVFRLVRGELVPIPFVFRSDDEPGFLD